MADIKSYMKEKEKREQSQADYKDKIRKHKRSFFYRFLLIFIIVAAVIFLMLLQYRNHIYTAYDTVSSANREATTSGAVNVRLGNAILTYSKDGAHCTDAKGNVTWNQTYEMQDILSVISGNMSAIAGYNGRDIYVQDAAKQICKITTTMPIRNIAVAATGRVTAIEADSDVTWINTYDTTGEKIYKGETHMNNSGYPVAISLSPNGELLGVSYVYVDAGVLKTNIVYYNFGPVGENNSDYIVSVYSYTDLLVPYLQFMNNTIAFAVGDSRLMIYGGDGQKPIPVAEYLFDEEVQSVFYSEKYIGLVFQAQEGDKKYRMDVYGVNTEKIGSYYFDIDYTDIFFGKDNFVAYNESQCVIMTMDGTEKFNGDFTKTAHLVVPVNSSYRYAVVTDDSIDTIQMR